MSGNKNAKTPADGPVAWNCQCGRPYTVTCILSKPSEREWVGLTDEEIHQAFCHVGYETPNDWNKDPESWCIANAKYLQAILKEKNHG